MRQKLLFYCCRGVAPFAQRRKLLEKQAASKNSSSSSGGSSSRYSSVNDAFASRSGDGASHLGQHSQQVRVRLVQRAY